MESEPEHLAEPALSGEKAILDDVVDNEQNEGDQCANETKEQTSAPMARSRPKQPLPALLLPHTASDVAAPASMEPSIERRPPCDSHASIPDRALSTQTRKRKQSVEVAIFRPHGSKRQRRLQKPSQFLDLEAAVGLDDNDDDDDMADEDEDDDFMEDLRREPVGNVFHESVNLHEPAAEGPDYFGAAPMVQATGDVAVDRIDAFGVPVTSFLPDITDPDNPAKTKEENDAKHSAQQSALKNDFSVSKFRQALLADLPLWEIHVWPRHEEQAVRWIKQINNLRARERNLDSQLQYCLNPWWHSCARGRIWFTARYMQDTEFISKKLPWRVPNRPTRRVAAPETDAVFRWILECETIRVKSALRNRQQETNSVGESRAIPILSLEEGEGVQANTRQQFAGSKRRASIPPISTKDTDAFLRCKRLQAGTIVRGSEVVITTGKHIGSVGMVDQLSPAQFTISILADGAEQTISIARPNVRLHFAMGQWVRVFHGRFKGIAGWVVDVRDVLGKIALKGMDGVDARDDGAVLIMCVHVPEGSDCVPRQVYVVHPYVVAVDDNVSYPDRTMDEWANGGIDRADDAPFCIDDGEKLVKTKTHDVRIGRQVVIRLGKFRERLTHPGPMVANLAPVFHNPHRRYCSSPSPSPPPIALRDFSHMISPQSPSPAPESVDDDDDDETSSRASLPLRSYSPPPYQVAPVWFPSSPSESVTELKPAPSASTSQFICRPWAGTTYCLNQLHKGKVGAVLSVDDERNEVTVGFGDAVASGPVSYIFSSDTVFDSELNVSMLQFNKMFGRMIFTNELFRRNLGANQGVSLPPKEDDLPPRSTTPDILDHMGGNASLNLQGIWDPGSRTPRIDGFEQESTNQFFPIQSKNALQYLRLSTPTLPADSVWHRINSVSELCNGGLLVNVRPAADGLTGFDVNLKHLQKATGWIQEWHGLQTPADVVFATHVYSSKTLINNWGVGVRTYPDGPIPIPLAFLQPIPLQRGYGVISANGMHRGVLKRLIGPKKQAYWDVFEGIEAKAKPLEDGKWRRTESTDGNVPEHARKAKTNSSTASHRKAMKTTTAEPMHRLHGINAASFAGSWFAFYEKHTNDRY